MQHSRRTLLAALLTLSACSPSGVPVAERGDPVAGWPETGNVGGNHFSPLTEITPQNVRHLEPVWVYHTGDYAGARADAGKTSFQATPILDEGTLYFCSALSRLFAVDAETGAEKWVYDARPEHAQIEWTKVCRGVSLWKSDNPDEAGCRKRLFMGTLDGGLVAVNAETGTACEDFGDKGRVDILAGLGTVEPDQVRITSFPVVVNDVVVSGHMVSDFSGYDTPGGVIRAWDVRSGKLRWAFDPVAPGTPALPANADGSPNFHRSTPDAWSILTVDHERDLVFVPMSSANMDYYGAPRLKLPVDVEYYANSLVALDAGSGEVKWRFQAVHHDLWDFDMSAQPALIDVWKDGVKVPAVAQATKMGHLYLLHRETGEPIYPVEERAVPQTDVPGEYTSPTQPFPTFPAPLHDRTIEAGEVFGFTWFDKSACREKIANARYEGIFTPPGFQRDAIHFPGQAGGSSWGGLAWHPGEKLVVLNQSQVASLRSIVTRDNVDESGPDADYFHLEGDYYLHGELLLSPFGVPCIKPPWGTLMAVSLETGRKIWEIPFGTTRDMVPVLSALPFGLNFGLPSAGGALVTESGLIFIGASLDNYIRAYALKSGKELWRARLPAGGQATPMTFRLTPEGRQYVVIAAGGHDTMRTKTGDSLIAYALPD